MALFCAYLDDDQKDDRMDSDPDEMKPPPLFGLSWSIAPSWCPCRTAMARYLLPFSMLLRQMNSSASFPSI
jgi:hypothetical protein